MNSKMRKTTAAAVLFAMAAGTVCHGGADTVSAASAPKLSKKKIMIEKGNTARITLKNKTGARKIKWSVSNKKVVQLKGKNAAVTVKGRKAGNTKVTCQFYYRGKKKKLVCQVSVKNERPKITWEPSAVPPSNPTIAPPSPAVPGQTAATPGGPQHPGVTQTPAPTATPTWEPIPVMNDVDANTTYDITGSLKGAFARFFGNVGTSVNIFQIDPAGSIFDNAGDMFEFVKKQYNSITPENESKPSRLLNMGTEFSDYMSTDFKAETMPVSEARANKYYYVPDQYKEAVCPKINYTQFDNFMCKAAESGMRIRFHAFVWHQQTPKWLFKENFDADANWVSQDVMDARMEYYIKSVIRYITLREEELGRGNIVYCYDVANEYFHNNDSKDDDGNYFKSYWDEVYYPDNEINTKSGKYTQVAEPVYIKRAFTYAREILDSYGKQDVTLFYNDYNTYQEKDSIIKLIEYLNKEKVICDGIGMQSHLDIGYPGVEFYAEALRTFLENENIHEVQITELDVTAYGSGEKRMQQQMEYYYKLIKAILDANEAYPGKITGMTFWGLYDQFSWRRDGKPLLFASTSKAKGVYYKVLQAAAEAAASSGN